MKHFFLQTRFRCLTAPLALVFFLATAAFVSASVCPDPDTIAHGQRYHADTTCPSREAFHHFKEGLQRPATVQKFRELGGVSSVPNQKTLSCPMSVADMREPLQPSVGMDTVFFVENKASTPVVVAYLDMDTGVEASAQNSAIQPAIADPNAILQPGQWMAVYAYEGHVFTVRSVLKGGTILGPILLQHRAGLIPVGEHLEHTDCSQDDVEPVVNGTRAKPFARTPPQPFRPCNTMDIGFRNASPCPLHGYYVEPTNEGSQEKRGCQESFKLHLGVQPVVPDFLLDWKSQTKYEGTFIGHTFHFRSAADPSVLVDKVTLAPVAVHDCPDTGVAATISVNGDATAMGVPLINFAGTKNATDDVVMNPLSLVSGGASISHTRM